MYNFFLNKLLINKIDVFRHKYPKLIKYTWWSTKTKAREKNIGWRLDYTVVNQEIAHFCQNSIIYDQIQGSDHCPIGLFLDFQQKNIKNLLNIKE